MNYYVSIVLDGCRTFIRTTFELCKFILLYFGCVESCGRPSAVSESKVMNPIENFTREKSGDRLSTKHLMSDFFYYATR